MKSILLPRHSLLLVLTVASALSLRAADKDGFVPMFNGRDLTGWHQVNCAPETFFVRDNMIITTGIPTGTLRTDRMYENFIIELEWRHMKSGGNSGLFLWGDPITAPGTPFSRGIEVQILDDGYNAKGKNEWFTTQGDLFPIHGATMTPLGRISKNGARAFPTEDRTKSSPEWNHYRVVCTNGTISHSINGKEVTTAKDCIPRKGYLCLESEGSECQFRNLRLKELPSSNPPPEYVAKEYEGFMPLYTGLDLRGWKQDPGHAGHWKPKDWILDYDGKSEAKDKNLWSEKEFGDFVLIADWRFTMKPEKKPLQLILPNGDDALDENGKKKLIEVDYAGDSGIYLRGSSKAQVNITCKTIGSGEIYGYRVDQQMPAEVRAGTVPKAKADNKLGSWNRFIITMKGDRVTVVLNNKLVIENLQLPGVAARGPIALQHHGDPVEFANIFVKELK